ncbi:FAD-dependent monooxygenase [Saccharopolyspora sp. NPDC003752]
MALGNFLLRRGIDCVIVEKHSREYVEQRQRAGVIDTRAARMFRAWGLEDRVVGGVPTEPVLNFRVDGETRTLTLERMITAFYLQCPLDSVTAQWTDERIWDELETRFGEPVAAKGPIVGTKLVPLRSVVYSPMSYGRPYLLGDAAHIVPPMSAKGMNLALHDAEVFANAVVHYQTEDHDFSLLDSYSSTCIRHVWNYQAFATWWTELVHNAGDASHQGEFRHQIARADIARLFESGSANRLLSEFIAGLN